MNTTINAAAVAKLLLPARVLFSPPDGPPLIAKPFSARNGPFAAEGGHKGGEKIFRFAVSVGFSH